MRKLILLFLAGVMLVPYCRADEGMWIPMLLKKYNIEDMQAKGFKLTAEDVYAINQASLKDAVVGLGREGQPFHHFCTGNLVSEEGLLITNHHCAFGMIQAHSSLEHNYLKDGFWAKNKSEELANPGITASILVRMEDVTEQVKAVLKEEMNEEERKKALEEVCLRLEEEAVAGTDLSADIKPYFNGNQFFMSVYRIYKDVRLVGAPPSAIGKFGGDTDNWTWPRHTGDFSVLRIYAGANNEPAEYSVHNKPYQPAAFFKVSARGVKEGDFTMVFGYPGTTVEYLPSYAIAQLIEVENPHKIAIRTAILGIINAAMNSDEALRIKYAAKAAGVANSWKKWQGENKGLKRFRTIENKQQLEKEFENWAQGKKQYAGLLEEYRKLYQQRKELKLAAVYQTEAGKKGAEIISFAQSLYTDALDYEKAEDKEAYKASLKKKTEDFFKDYDAGVDQAILAEMLRLYNTNLPENWIPAKVVEAKKAPDYSEYAEKLFRRSLCANPAKVYEFIEKLNQKSAGKIKKDPAYQLANSLAEFQKTRIRPELSDIERKLTRLNRLWLAGLMEMQTEKTFYADANSTLRVAYGTIGGYSPRDAVEYQYYTTLEGIMEKDNPDIYDYNIPQKLRDLYAAKDFGPYTQNGKVPVCFIASNHTTGGNSGSCVLNAEGYLTGLNFDRAWDGVMSDMQYDPEICRNIAVDIRYVLFIMDKLAGAKHLMEEMEIVW